MKFGPVLLMAALVAAGCARQDPAREDHAPVASVGAQPAGRASVALAQGAINVHEEVTRMYRPATYAAARAVAAVPGASLDASMVESYAHGVCHLAFKRPSAPTARVAVSYDEVDRFKRRFCADFDGQAPQNLFDIMAAAAERGDEDAALIDAMFATDAESDPREIERLRTLAEVRAQATDSPLVFRLLHEELLREEFRQEDRATWLETGLSEEEAARARGYGVTIAVCDRYRICPPGSLMVLAHCHPTDCAPGLDMHAYVRSQLKPAAYDEAVRYAAVLGRELREKRQSR